MDSLKLTDAINPLYLIMINYSGSTVSEDALKAIVLIGKKYPSDIMNCDRIKYGYKDILPSNNNYSFKKKKNIFILFKEIVKEGIIKKGDYGSSIIEEILFIGEEMERRKEQCRINQDFVNECITFVRILKEEGFEKVNDENVNEIKFDFVYYEWKVLCQKEKDNISDDESECSIKEEEKEEVKKFCSYFLNQTFDVQIEFLKRMYNILCNEKRTYDFYCIKNRKNGFILYLLLPIFFKNYHFEEILPLLLNKFNNDYIIIAPCYKFIIKLYNEIIERIMKESEENIEISEELIAVTIFFWSITEERKNEKEIECLINLTIKVFKWLGRLEEEQEEVKESEKKQSIKVDSTNMNEIKEEVNRKEFILYRIVDSIDKNKNKYAKKDKYIIEKDERIGDVLLEIVKNHLKNERCLIEKGNIKRIIEYIIYSYNKDIDTSYSLSLLSPSFPFSHNTLSYILSNIYEYFTQEVFREIKKKDILIDVIEIINNYLDIIKIIDECDIKKEIEKEILIEWNNNTKNGIFKKISFNWKSFSADIIFSLTSFGFSSFGDDNNNIIKRLIKIFFIHSNNQMYNDKKEKEENNKDMKEIILIRPFILDEKEKRYFITGFLSVIRYCYCYSITDYYYLLRNYEKGCGIINIFMKELSGEIFDRIKRREGNNIIKERKRYERERIDKVYEEILCSLEEIIVHISKGRQQKKLGLNNNKVISKRNENKVEETINYVEDVIEEEDLRECIILFLEFMKAEYILGQNNNGFGISLLASYSKNILLYLF